MKPILSFILLITLCFTLTSESSAQPAWKEQLKRQREFQRENLKRLRETERERAKHYDEMYREQVKAQAEFDRERYKNFAEQQREQAKWQSEQQREYVKAWEEEQREQAQAYRESVRERAELQREFYWGGPATNRFIQPAPGFYQPIPPAYYSVSPYQQFSSAGQCGHTATPPGYRGDVIGVLQAPRQVIPSPVAPVPQTQLNPVINAPLTAPE